MVSEQLAEREDPVPIDLSGAHLLGADFRSAQLAEADLHGANLAKADFERANLRGANLSKARLIGANLRDANLCAADFSSANLEDASLVGADASDARFQNASLSNTDFSGAKLSGASGLSWSNFLSCRFSTETVFPSLNDNDLFELLEGYNPHIPWRGQFAGKLPLLIAELAAFHNKAHSVSLVQVLIQMRMEAEERNE